MRQGVELRTRCRVREITLDDAGMANGVWYYDQDGAEQFQQAAVVILATNGVGTPRLMLIQSPSASLTAWLTLAAWWVRT